MEVNRTRLPESVRKEVAASQGWRCFACQHSLPSSFDVDHVLGRAEGGTNDLSNLQALCCNCHRSKTVADAQRRARERAVVAQARTCRVQLERYFEFDASDMLPATLVRHVMTQHCKWPAVRVDRWLVLVGCKIELWTFPFPHEVWNHVYEAAALEDAPVMDYPVTGLRMRLHPRL